MTFAAGVPATLRMGRFRDLPGITVPSCPPHLGSWQWLFGQAHMKLCSWREDRVVFYMVHHS